MLMFAMLVTCLVWQPASAKKSGDFEYEEMSGSITIKEYKGKAAKVIIPARIDGKKVTKIDDYAFFCNRKLTEVTMPDSIKAVGCGAFQGCSLLKKVGMSKLVREIPNRCFYYCKKLKEINFANLEKICDEAFARCYSLTGTLDLTNAQNVYYTAFEKCKKITGVVFSDKLELLGASSPKETPSNPFADCSSLASVRFNAKNKIINVLTGRYTP